MIPNRKLYTIYYLTIIFILLTNILLVHLLTFCNIVVLKMYVIFCTVKCYLFDESHKQHVIIIELEHVI